jgi:hypothetical protein
LISRNQRLYIFKTNYWRSSSGNVGHNPVRAKKIDGIEIDWSTNNYQFDLKPSSITIEEIILLKEAKKLWKDSYYLKKLREKYG